MAPKLCFYCGKIATEAGRLPSGIVPKYPNVCIDCRKLTAAQQEG